MLKKGQSFCRKDSVLGGHIPVIIPDMFQQIPIGFTNYLKNPYFGSLLPGHVCIKLTFQFYSKDNTFKSK